MILLIACSLGSALAAVGLYRWITPPERVIIRESVEAKYANYSDWLDDIRPRTFHSTEPTNFTTAAELATPSVVFIRAYQEGSSFPLFGRTTEPITAASGSGVIIGSDGYIVTNNHVIEGGDVIEVTLSDKRRFEAEVVGADPSTDLALLRIGQTGLLAIEMGNSDSVRIGEWVLAVGNPFNLESTVTAGIVSAKGRSIDILEGQDRIESFIQTDAAVNPGNSGGALVNSNGELVGINTAIVTRSGRYEGYSFAVPSNLVRKIVRDLRDYGSVQRGLMGVYIEEINADLAEQLGLERVAGVVVTRVSEGGGADLAGLERGDVITGINGQPTLTAPALQELLGQFRPGNQIQVDFLRDGEARQVEVILKNKLNSTTTLSATDEALLHDLGFELRNLTNEEINRLEMQGVKVMSVFRSSIVADTRMEPGFIITHLNDREVNDVDQLLRRLSRAEGKVVLRGVYENYEGDYFYAFNKE
ncbi:MAG: trypsin-like peptidase domain-containing protein [Lewinella sp.]|nr:trypsin-like peptidase domain-containing protein [Lewinella sp.]